MPAGDAFHRYRIAGKRHTRSLRNETDDSETEEPQGLVAARPCNAQFLRLVENAIPKLAPQPPILKPLVVL
ncbi:hypothetical protein NWI01_31560 [Nitrobacter winogradskyi]|uniref:Uncharacterized protein n=1 Tax=Nitrobacter winogradskyi TaxID=913 RepID=A0A4Y3WEF1_NITWI|nr:hypothetical protein NWI01_31560 [Nitrobacter winogradskyi]